MIRPFEYNIAPSRVIFDELSSALIRSESAKLGMHRPMIVCTRSNEETAHEISRLFGDRTDGVFASAVMHTPVATTLAALEIIYRTKADGVIAIGGGSAIGLSKAVALRADLQQLVIPTTYGGSEMTPILGETIDGIKHVQNTQKVLPATVIYDVNLTLTMPVSISISSGMNAIAHAVEALYAERANPLTSTLAQAGISSLYHALSSMAKTPFNIESRSDALYGAWLCGICLGTLEMALHHKICHVLGGAFNLPHAQMHALLLPYTLAYNAPAIPAVMKSLTVALKCDDPIDGIYNVSKQVCVGGLQELGMPSLGIDCVLDSIVNKPFWNPRSIERAPLHDLLQRAWLGLPPQK